MSQALKCPNPSCPFLFDPTLVPPGAVLTCPRCGMRFQLGPPPPAAAAAPVPQPEPAPPPPPPTDDRRRGPRPARPRADGRSPWPVVGGVLMAVGFAVVAGTYFVSQFGKPDAGNTRLITIRDYNCAIDPPGPPWEKDPAPPAAAAANLLLLKRADAEVRVGFAASNFETREPQPGDLREPILDRLRGLFDDLDPTEAKGATWAGRPAIKYTFRGTEKATGAAMAGEAYAVAAAGIGYWCLAWAPEREVAGHVAAFDDLRGRFTILDLRADWKPTAAAFQVFSGVGENYTLTDTERWWKRPPGLVPADEDPLADLVLKAEYVSRKKTDVRPTATLVIYVLEPAGTPLETIRSYIKTRYAKRAELFGAFNITDVTGEPQGDPPGNVEQQVMETARLHAASAKDPAASKLLVLSAVAVNGKVVAAEATCPWADRPLWERRLVHVVGSLRPGK